MVKPQFRFAPARYHPMMPNSEPPIIVHLPEFTPGFPTSGPREGRKRGYGAGCERAARGVAERVARGLRKGSQEGRVRVAKEKAW